MVFGPCTGSSSVVTGRGVTKIVWQVTKLLKLTPQNFQPAARISDRVTVDFIWSTNIGVFGICVGSSSFFRSREHTKMLVEVNKGPKKTVHNL